MFYDNHELLYKKFDTFSDMSVGGDSAGALTDGMMTLPEFVNLIEKACLLGDNQVALMSRFSNAHPVPTFISDENIGLRPIY